MPNVHPLIWSEALCASIVLDVERAAMQRSIDEHMATFQARARAAYVAPPAVGNWDVTKF